MRFSVFLSCHLLDVSYPPERLYAEVLEQAKLAEDLGFDGLSLPEHHLVNVLMNPNPLMFAVKLASVTERLPITTAVLVLPFHDMRRLAGDIALADMLIGGERLELGCGRGAFAYEFGRFGVPVETSRAVFDESLDVLEALLSGTDVAWDGEHYKFEPLTIMPRPLRKPRIWIAALGPEAIYHCARKGYDVQTTPLRGGFELGKKQAAAFHRGKAETDAPVELSMLRSAYVARDEADARAKREIAYQYGRRFTNAFETPGTVKAGELALIELEYTLEDAAKQLIVGTEAEITDKIGAYVDLGMDEISLDMHLGIAHRDVMASMERFAAKVMPQFKDTPRLVDAG